MLVIATIAEQIVTKRKALGLTQTALAQRAHVSRSTLGALENGRMGELGYTKIVKILTSLGLELRLQEASSRRPTLENLLREASGDSSLD